MEQRKEIYVRVGTNSNRPLDSPPTTEDHDTQCLSSTGNLSGTDDGRIMIKNGVVDGSRYSFPPQKVRLRQSTPPAA